MSSVQNIDALLSLLLIGLTKLGEFGSVIALARQEGRDVTDEEMAAVGAQSQSAINRFKALLGGA